MDVIEQIEIETVEQENVKSCKLKKIIKWTLAVLAALAVIAITLYGLGIYKTQRFNKVSETKTQVEVLVDELNVRETPSAAAKKLSVLTRGEIVTVADTYYTPESAWYEIRIGCWEKAYIFAGTQSEYLKLSVAKDTPAASNGRDESVAQIKIDGEFRNIRSENNVNAKIIGRATANDIYDVLDISIKDNIWYKIKTNTNIEGWISGTTGVEYLYPGTIPYVGVYDAQGGTAISQNGCDYKIFPASLTKLFTAYTAMQHMPLDAEIKVGTEINMINDGSSRANIKQGQVFSLRELIAGMLVASGNDAAYSVAVNVARAESQNADMSDAQAVKHFCDLMNSQAEKLGLKASHFANPDGWDATNHYTTISDIAAVSTGLIKSEEIRNIVNKHEIIITSKAGERIALINTNQLLNRNSEYYCANALGLKTGSTDLAGKCLAALVNVSGREYIIVSVGNLDEEQRYQSVLQEIEKLKNR